MTDIREQEMQNRIDSLTLEKENLRNENIYLKEQVAHLKKLAFGSRSEKTKKVLSEVEEINLFDEAEVEAKGSAPEPVICRQTAMPVMSRFPARNTPSVGCMPAATL